MKEVLYSTNSNAIIDGDLVIKLNERFKPLSIFNMRFGGRLAFHWKGVEIYLPESVNGNDWSGFFIRSYKDLEFLSKVYFSPSTSQILWHNGKECWLCKINGDDSFVSEVIDRSEITCIEMMHRSNTHDWVEKPWGFWQDRTI